MQFSALQLGEATVIQKTEVLDQVPPKNPSWLRIHLLNGTNHKHVQPTRIRKVNRSGINDVVVDLAIRITARKPRMRRDDYVDAFVARRLANSVEVGWELHVAEEGCGSVHGEFTVCGHSTVDEEVDGEDGLTVRRDIAHVLEGELGVGRDGVLNTRVAELGCDRKVVETSSVSVAEIDKLEETVISALVKTPELIMKRNALTDLIE